jgi:hypothetical protein
MNDHILLSISFVSFVLSKQCFISQTTNIILVTIDTFLIWDCKTVIFSLSLKKKFHRELIYFLKTSKCIKTIDSILQLFLKEEKNTYVSCSITSVVCYKMYNSVIYSWISKDLNIINKIRNNLLHLHLYIALETDPESESSENETKYK